MAAVIIAAAAVALLVTALVLAGRHHAAVGHANAALPSAAYASHLDLSNLQMSQSGNMAGGKQTYIEGHITNKGPATVTAITVQAVFANDATMPPQIETSPLNVIYMREPYVDTRPLSASPLPPGGQADFRLIFEDISDNWNQQMPQLHIVQAETR